jgi:hypothetical protein
MSFMSHCRRSQEWAMSTALGFKPIHEGSELVHGRAFDIESGDLDVSRGRCFGRALTSERGSGKSDLGIELRKKLTMQQILVDDVTNVR